MTIISRIRLLAGSALLALSIAIAGVIEDAQKLVSDGKFDDAITLLEKSDAKKPAIAKALATAHLAKADYFMANPTELPMRKYPVALREYRKVVVYDKTNRRAQDSVRMIEDIYRRMGREIPK